jgi:hypothetical protein
MKILICLLIVIFSCEYLTAENGRISAYRTEEKIVLDGQLYEKAWSDVVRISNFTQRELNNGSTPSEKTEVGIVYNDNYLYIGVWCYDSNPAEIISTQMQRDFSWGVDDNFELVIDTYNDNRNGYLFVTNPSGARADAMIQNDGIDVNTDWNGVWDVETTINEKGWFAEFEIPFSSLKFDGDTMQTWGINFERNIRRKLEQILWQGWSRNFDLEMVSQAGNLIGLSNVKAGEIIELKPYITAGYEKINNNDKNQVKVGGDINYLITPTLKMNLTFNTDFAQVESDRIVTNLTRYDIFYPEKREFFLEGKDFFSFETSGHAQIFYSRRIGASDLTESVPIIAGGRLFGKTGNTNIGIISMQLAEKDEEPTTNYSVVRLKQDVLENSSLGMVLTSKYSKDHYNYVYGFDFRYYTPEFLGDKRLEISTSVAHSITKDSTNKNSVSYRIAAEYPNDEIYLAGGFVAVPKGFNPEVGFTRRTNFTSPFLFAGYTPRFDSSFIRSISFSFNFDSYFHLQTGLAETIAIGIKPLGVNFRSGENIAFGVNTNYERLYESFNLAGAIEITPGEYIFSDYRMSFYTLASRPVSAGLEIASGEFWSGSKNTLNTSITIRYNRNLNFGADHSFNYIDIGGTIIRTNNIGGRVSYALNPKLNTSLFGQWNDSYNSIILNYRIYWIPVIGSDFYFVINQFIDTSGKSWKFTDFSAYAKFLWRLGV